MPRSLPELNVLLSKQLRELRWESGVISVRVASEAAWRRSARHVPARIVSRLPCGVGFDGSIGSIGGQCNTGCLA
jgi:hypothetical protein